MSVPLPARAPRRIALAVIALVALALAALDAAPRGEAQPLDLGDENSWLRVQNVGGRAAEVEIDFYDLGGDMVGSDGCPLADGCPALSPGFGWSFFQQGHQPLDDGYRGSAYVTVDQPFVALLARDVFRDGLFRIAGDTLRLSVGSDAQYAPIVQRSPEYVSRLSIENTSDEHAACFEILYYSEGVRGAAAIDPPAPTPGCPRGGELVPPRGTLLRDERSLPVPEGFDGAAFVRSLPTASGVRPSAQQPSLVVDTREREGPGLAMYRAFDGSELSRELVLPLVDRNASEGQTTWTTRFRILNRNLAAPNEVQLLYVGRDARRRDRDRAHSRRAPGADLRPAPRRGRGLPARRRRAARPVLRLGADPRRRAGRDRRAARLGDGALADYRGFTAEEAAREVVLPVLNKNFGPWGGHSGWNSWVRLLAFDGGEVRVRAIYYSSGFPKGLVSPLLRADGPLTLRQWENANLPDGWVGSAIVIADRPVVALANLESDVFEGDPAMIYNGVSVY